MDFYRFKSSESLDNLGRRDRVALEMAAQSATLSDFTSSRRLGACIRIDGSPRVMIAGFNQRGRVRILREDCNSVHAEIHALAQFLNTYRGRKRRVTLYVVRLMRNKSKCLYGNSKPCTLCQEKLKAHVDVIKYTDVDDTGTQNVLKTLVLKL